MTESAAGFPAPGSTIEQLNRGDRAQPVIRAMQDRHTSKWQHFERG